MKFALPFVALFSVCSALSAVEHDIVIYGGTCSAVIRLVPG